MPSDAQPADSKRLATGAFLCLLGLLIAAFLVYRSSLNGPFPLDDQANIPQAGINALTAPALLALSLDGDSFFDLSRVPRRISFALAQWLSDDKSFAFKYQNPRLHLLNGLQSALSSGDAARLYPSLNAVCDWSIRPFADAVRPTVGSLCRSDSAL